MGALATAGQAVRQEGRRRPRTVGAKKTKGCGAHSRRTALPTEEVAAMVAIRSSLAGLLSRLAPCFTAPSYRTFCMLTVGFIARIRENTVTGMLQAAGLAGVWHHSRAHAFFAYRRWDPDELGIKLLELLVSVLVAPGPPICGAADAPLWGRRGRRVSGPPSRHEG